MDLNMDNDDIGRCFLISIAQKSSKKQYIWQLFNHYIDILYLKAFLILFVQNICPSTSVFPEVNAYFQCA